MVRGLEHRRAGLAQSGKGNALGRPCNGLSILKGGPVGKIGEESIRKCSDRRRGNDFKLRKIQINISKKVCTVRVVRTQRSCGCPISGRVQRWIKWCFE